MHGSARTAGPCHPVSRRKSEASVGMDPDATDLHGSPVMGAGAIPWVDALMLSSSVSYAARRAVASRLRVKPVNTPKRRGRWPNPAVVRNIGPVGHPEPHKGAPYGSP